MAEGNPVQYFWDQFLFPRIFRTFRMAIHPRKMTIAFLAVAAIGLLGWIMDFNRLVTRGQSGLSSLDFYMAGESRLGGPMGLSPPSARGVQGTVCRVVSIRIRSLP